MIYKIYNNNKEVTYTTDKEEQVKSKLLELLYNKYILKSKEIKQVQYKYSYDDLQRITFIYNNNYRIEFSYIPTRHGYMESYML